MTEPIYDLVIIGGGINGSGIARNAAGRGLKVLLAEQADLGSADEEEIEALDGWIHARRALPGRASAAG